MLLRLKNNRILFYAGLFISLGIAQGISATADPNLFYRTVESINPNKPVPADLCQVKNPGTEESLICKDNLSIPRSLMPQLGGKLKEKSPADELRRLGVLKTNTFGGVDISPLFMSYLKNQGVKINPPGLVPAARLKPTQADIIAEKVAGITKTLKANPHWQEEIQQRCTGRDVPDSPTKDIVAPIFVSNDNYILDGHHRWASILAAVPENKAQICVIKIDLKMGEKGKIEKGARDLVNMSNDFALEMGILPEAGTITPAETYGAYTA